MITIREITQWEEHLPAQLEALLPQLNPSMCRIPEKELQTLILSPESHLLAAEEEEQMVGMLTVAFYPTLTALRGWVEDVVVNETARRKGIGRMLLRRAVEIAREKGCKTLSLTSSPHRKAAHALYLNEGFQPIETQPFRMILEE